MKRSAFLIFALTCLAAAAPRPQDIELDDVEILPSATVDTPPNDISSQTVYIQPEAAASTIAAAAVTDIASAKRSITDGSDLSKRDGDCKKLPPGTGVAVHTPDDTADSFLNYSPFRDTANSADTPQGYTSTFTNLNGSTQTTGYLGFITLKSYDTIRCSQYCDELDGCQAFNLYFERDPTLSSNKITCPNPPSLTNIKCVRWGVQILPETATNVGQYRNQFHVVISGSNGYNKNAPPPAQPGFKGPTELGGAINAPLDPVTHQNTYMGHKFFSFGTGPNQIQFYNPAVCTAACTAQSAYNIHHPPSSGHPVLCNQVVAYVLSDENAPQGLYCSMYSEAWAPQYSDNHGQYRDHHYWSVSQAYSYTNETYAEQYDPICAVGGCPAGSYHGGNCGGYGPGTC